MAMEDIAHKNTWIEICESTYAKNLTFFRDLIGHQRELAAVIKANAYGHDWKLIAHLAIKHGADSFCVHSLEEALKIRNIGFTQDILVMGYIPLEQLEEAVQANLRIGVFNQETLLRLDKLISTNGKQTKIHLKLETGTYRHGIEKNKLPWFLERLKKNPLVKLEAVYTHFANIEDTTNHEYAETQKYCFEQMFNMIQKAGFPKLHKHSACSAAALLFPQTHFDMIRLGIGQYGHWPSRETLVSFNEKNGIKIKQKLQPILSWKTRVAQLKWVPAEKTIGYGRTYKTTRDTRIAVLPIGYSDGYDRGLSNQAYVLIRGKCAPVCGRICMNLMMVNVTDIPGVELEDEVILIGREGGEEITADTLASLCGTIHYEILARINPDIPRMII